MDTHHGQFYNISGRALNWRINGVTLSETTYVGIVRIDIGQKTFAMKKSFYVASLTSFFNAAIHVDFYLRKRSKITINQFFSFGTRNSQSLRQPKY